MPIDKWRIAAETDDVLVAELLLTIKHSGETWTATPTRTSVKPAVASASSSGGGLLPFRWGRRRPRSMPGVTRFVTDKVYKERAIRSPTTPLSWSGGGGTSVSASGNGDGYEASSMMCHRSTYSRSKITAAAYDLANSKRAKRKKTYNELKEEECSLLQERRNLKMDLVTLRTTLTGQKMTNQNLKTIKSRRMITSASGDPFAGCSTQTQTVTSMIQVAFTVQETNNKSFMLPDLNMPPSAD
ncbi:unnamed protein product [Rhodiola kirilowii]